MVKSTVDQNTDIAFEQLLSYRPLNALYRKPGLDEPELCLRDMIFDYYCGLFQDTDKATAATKAYTDALYDRFQVTRRRK